MAILEMLKASQRRLRGLSGILLLSFIVGCTSSMLSTEAYKRESSETTALPAQTSTIESQNDWTLAFPETNDEISLRHIVFPLQGGKESKLAVYSVSLQSCGFDSDVAIQQESLARQIFIGFENLRIHALHHPDWLEQDQIVLTAVEASLDDLPLSAIVFSAIDPEACLLEQAFWTHQENNQLNISLSEEAHRKLYSELDSFPEWKAVIR